jgi:hypothetical protein
MKKTAFFALCSAVIGMAVVSAERDCLALSLTIKKTVEAQPSKVLEIVSAQVAAAPACSCEIVKAAIEGSSASAETVAAIVEAAVTAAPDHMRLIAQCAVAVAPDALVGVQAVLTKLGDVGEVAAMPNPLDFPGDGPVGPRPGGPGGMPLVPFLPPFIVASPDDITPVNP